MYLSKCNVKKSLTTSPVGVGNSVFDCFSTYPRVSIVEMIEAYVDGRPIPLASSSFTSPASVYLFGGRVSFSITNISSSFNPVSIDSFGSNTSSPRPSGSAASQPSNFNIDPLTANVGTRSSLDLAIILVRSIVADII